MPRSSTTGTRGLAGGSRRSGGGARRGHGSSRRANGITGGRPMQPYRTAIEAIDEGYAGPVMTMPDRHGFHSLAREGNAVVLRRRLMSDQLTPVLAYRRLVEPDERTAPSFLLESVETGGTVGRFSYLGAQPDLELLATRPIGHDHRPSHRRASRADGARSPVLAPLAHRSWRIAAPHGGDGAGAAILRRMGRLRRVRHDALPRAGEAAVLRGAARRSRPARSSLRALPTGRRLRPRREDAVRLRARRARRARVGRRRVRRGLRRAGRVRHSASSAAAVAARGRDRPGSRRAARGGAREQLRARRRSRPRCGRAKEYIAAGDAFQIVLSQRFQRITAADPFDIYRALRIVNPSPYMIYLQARGSILVASSPEILCRTQGRQVTNRPLAGTRPRGSTAAGGRGAGRRAARRSQGAGRARDARRSGAQRPRPRVRAGIDSAAARARRRALQPRDAPQLDGDRHASATVWTAGTRCGPRCRWAR